MEKFVLCNTPTVTHRVAVKDDQSIALSMDVHFELSPEQVSRLKGFLEAVQANKDVRHSYFWNGDDYWFTYDPEYGSSDKFVINHQRNWRVISMGWSTAGRLLKALNGETANLVREDSPGPDINHWEDDVHLL